MIIISPIIPHFAHECLDKIGIKKDFKWPEVDKNKIKLKQVNYVIQFNGKKRAKLSLKPGLTEKELIQAIINNAKLKKFFENKKIYKTFFVKNRLINFLLK